MPAIENVAAELRSPDEAIEMAVPPPELESSGGRASTPIKDESRLREAQKVKSEVMSSVGETLAVESEPVSPLSPVSEDSPRSMADLLCRLSE
jgi:hypothetical protein